jgi:DNA-binding CsgD family transcriptional regulator
VSASVETPTGHRAEPREWARLLATGAMIDDLRPCVIARYAGVSELAAGAALAYGEEIGLIAGDNLVDLPALSLLIEQLTVEDRRRISSAIGRSLLTARPSEIDEVHHHCRTAAGWLDPEGFVAMADHAGQLSLSTQRYESALSHLQLVVDLTASNDPAYPERLCLLAHALEGVGQLEAARNRLEQAISLAVIAQDAPLVARAAVRFAMPADWLHGDTRAAQLLIIAASMEQSPADAAMISAAQGMIHMRIPLVHDDPNQYGWVTRPAIAQAATQEALQATDPSWIEARTIALIAWRSTHRAPIHLQQRRLVTSELLDLAHKANDARSILLAAEWAAVDAIEAADREAYDRNLAVASWAADRDGNPRLKWRATSLAAGAALLDDDALRASALVIDALEALRHTDACDWEGTSVFFLAQEVIGRDDPKEMAQYLEFASSAVELSPLGQVGFSYVLARAGDHERARDYLDRSWRSLDEEASFLLHASGLVATSMRLGDFTNINKLIDLLTPYADHVAVDSHGWWVNGPVSGWLAILHSAAGQNRTSREYLHAALPVAQSINDGRTLRRLEKLTEYLDRRAGQNPIPKEVEANPSLGEREVEVLRLMAAGMTNAEIAEQMAFSLSTIRNATVEIYRRLNAKGRADAVTAAHRLGLLHDKS